ncbi:hypothetical protein F5B22DRAFT_608381 [Xylaria bambusicola]|uniref:uncharacterized protein n=1 Tax=Xylaria bambusicola TaxID=326684 RepID=UPI00200875DC|nr:uncharacterized protein F5B22DRAFT_608381 [Xylaria bambusicola]KAI0515116.1 hypothetical protein F5B22DRAFT_608381 [Xylaria bambusicola]
MLPPVDNSVLTNNPRFEKLYNTITTSILNPDGSTKLDPSAKQRDAVREELQAYRLKAARVHLLRTAISTAASTQTTPTAAAAPSQEPDQGHQKQQSRYQQKHPKSRQPSQLQAQQQSLPPDLLQLLLLLSSFLNNASHLPAQSVSLLLTSPPFTHLPTFFPHIAALVSSVLTSDAKALARVLSPSTNPSYIHRAIPSLPRIASTLISDLTCTKQSLSHARLSATASLAQHHTSHTEVLKLLLRSLEAKHGPMARISELRAQNASQNAQAWAIAAEALLWETRHRVYPPSARSALLHYRQHLLDAGRRLEDGSRTREAELADYGVDVDKLRKDALTGAGGSESQSQGRRRGRRGTTVVDENKERTMREMARVWREMETRLREINGDLNRLR